MKLRNVIAAASAAIMAVSAMALSAFALDNPANSVVIGFADVDWKAGWWAKAGDSQDFNDYCTPVQITGNGTYTVKVDLSSGYTNEGWEDEDTGELIEFTTANGVAAMGLIYNSTDTAVGFDVTSIKFDGAEVALNGRSFTNDEDGGRRTNLYNEWASFNADEHLTLDPASANCKLFDAGSVGEWTTLEVTFDVYGLADAPADAPAEAPAGDKGSPDTGVAGVAAVAGAAALAAGVMVASRKRK